MEHPIMDETIKSETDTFCSTDMSQPLLITEVHFEQDQTISPEQPIKINDKNNVLTITATELDIPASLNISPELTILPDHHLTPTTSPNSNHQNKIINYSLKSTDYVINIQKMKRANVAKDKVKFIRNDLKLNLKLPRHDEFSIHVEIIYPEGIESHKIPCSTSPERRLQRGKFKYKYSPIEDVSFKSCLIEENDETEEDVVDFITNYLIYTEENALALDVTVNSKLNGKISRVLSIENNV